MSDIFISSERSRPPRSYHGNNCNGYFTSIANGRNGHSVNDGCDRMNPETSIDFIIPLLPLSAFSFIVKQKS